MFFISAEILTIMILTLIAIGMIITFGIIFEIVVSIICICKYLKNKEERK